MGLETATYIHQLNATNPVGGTDNVDQGDDHIRLLKSTIQASFPNIAGAMTISHTRLNDLGAMLFTGTGFANPSGTIGLTAVNGVATTAMRSDGAPALSQAIAPTWTGTHLFSGAPNYGAAGSWTTPGAGGNFPSLTFRTSASVTDGRIWQHYVDTSAGSYIFAAVNDGASVLNRAIQVERSGAAVTELRFGNTTNNPAYLFLGTGDTIFNGCPRVVPASAESLRLQHAAAYIAFFNAAGSTRHGYLQGQAGGMAIGSDAGSITLVPNGNSAVQTVISTTGAMTVNGAVTASSFNVP